MDKGIIKDATLTEEMPRLVLLTIFLLLLQSCVNFKPENLMSEASQSSFFSKSLAFSLDPSADRPEISFDLSDYQWQHRILLIFAPSERSPAYQQQMKQWDIKDMQERQLKLVEVLGTELGQVDGQRISAPSVKQLRHQFGVAAEDFAIILVGKDGTEKQRSQTPVDPATIFQAIDAMPLRHQEMRNRQ